MTESDWEQRYNVERIACLEAERRLEEQTRSQRQTAEDANRLKSDFLANMSHEIRTPMSGLIDMIDLALETRLDSEQQAYLSLAKSSAEHLLTRLNDILGIPKIEAGELDLHAREQANSPPITRHGPRAKHERPAYHLLLVEDNPINQQLAMQLLIKKGYAVTHVENGLEALEALDKTHYDLILMDIMMPKMDGLEATRRIRAREAATGNEPTPILAVTANAMHGDRDRCLAAGMDGYVSKPMNPELLLGEIWRLIDARRGAAQGTSEIDALPVLDKKEALSRIEDEELYLNLIEMFVADSARYLADLKESIQADDRSRLTRAAHTLKGILATLSAKRAEWAARQLELAAPKGETATLNERLHLIEAEVHAFLKYTAPT